MKANKNKGTSVGFSKNNPESYDGKRFEGNTDEVGQWEEPHSKDANYVHNLFFLNADVWTEENDWTMSIQAFKKLFTDNEAIHFAEWLELEGYHIKGMDDGQRGVIYEKFKNR